MMKNVVELLRKSNRLKIDSMGYKQAEFFQRFQFEANLQKTILWMHKLAKKNGLDGKEVEVDLPSPPTVKLSLSSM